MSGLSSATPRLPERFVRDASAELRPGGLVLDPDLVAAQSVDWTGRFRGTGGAVARPGDAHEVATLVHLARRHGVALVPQGGNTGLVGGAVPHDGAVVVDLRRLDQLIDTDARSGQITAGAGATIAAVQAAAARIGWAYGVDWAARDSATLGGSVATDAGGLRFLRHGGTRRQLLGVEAVLGTGDTVTVLPRVEKDNTGYHLPSVLCGSEGTLGMLTAVRVRLVPPSAPLATALVAFADTTDAIDAAAELRRGVPGLEAVEFMVRCGVDLVCETHGLAAPFDDAHAVLLVELADQRDPVGALGEAIESLGRVVATAVADDDRRRRQLWAYRELHTEAIARVGTPHKLDVTLPLDELASFVEDIPARIAAVDPSAQVWLFGHAADGNVHVNVTGLAAADERVDELVFEDVVARGGSISAEHGIGRAKRRWLHLAKDAASVRTMWHLKDALDPSGILNPGVLLPERT